MNSRYRKTRDLIDYDYTSQLSDAEADFLDAFTASYYNGSASEAPGSVPAAEAAELNAARRRDVFGALERVSAPVGELTEWPPYRRAFADERKRAKRARKGAA